ncbi:hypothetical protein NP233_g7475 [Leucocoprinus birnbaumii]|uniref:Uncharacterized protein n=1 Tax=Leucocoprinus birnbaumii TaxID=56174 RepID=A0AAD5VRT6_9AGAR|nr:hypothetical protein NP233_g7475 [Leucocoprinus birnbaumii]
MPFFQGAKGVHVSGSKFYEIGEQTNHYGPTNYNSYAPGINNTIHNGPVVLPLQNDALPPSNAHSDEAQKFLEWTQAGSPTAPSWFHPHPLPLPSLSPFLSPPQGTQSHDTRVVPRHSTAPALRPLSQVGLIERSSSLRIDQCDSPVAEPLHDEPQSMDIDEVPKVEWMSEGNPYRHERHSSQSLAKTRQEYEEFLAWQKRGSPTAPPGFDSQQATRLNLRRRSTPLAAPSVIESTGKPLVLGRNRTPTRGIRKSKPQRPFILTPPPTPPPLHTSRQSRTSAYQPPVAPFIKPVDHHTSSNHLRAQIVQEYGYATSSGSTQNSRFNFEDSQVNTRRLPLDSPLSSPAASAPPSLYHQLPTSSWLPNERDLGQTASNVRVLE